MPINPAIEFAKEFAKKQNLLVVLHMKDGRDLSIHPDGTVVELEPGNKGYGFRLSEK